MIDPSPHPRLAQPPTMWGMPVWWFMAHVLLAIFMAFVLGHPLYFLIYFLIYFLLGLLARRLFRTSTHP